MEYRILKVGWFFQDITFLEQKMGSCSSEMWSRVKEMSSYKLVVRLVTYVTFILVLRQYCFKVFLIGMWIIVLLICTSRKHQGVYFCFCFLFLHSPCCRAEGLCRQTAIKLHRHHHRHMMLNEPIRAKHVMQSSSVIGWQNWGQAGTSKCTLALCRCVHKCTKAKLIQAKCVHWKCEFS